MPVAEAAPEAALIDEVADWLMERALVESSLTEIAEGCFLRLHAAGIPLSRSHIAFRTLHPLYGAVGVTWTPSNGIVMQHYADPDETNEAWRQSPGYHLIRTRLPFLRRRLTGPEAQLDFPVLEDFREQGASDYLAYLFIFDETQETGVWGSWLCDRPSGFSEAELRALQRIQRRLAVALKVTIKEQIARNVVTTYLGPGAGERVLRGQIRRGDGERLHAAIWMSDLRDSTALAAALPPEEFLALLNGYFECTAGAVLARGGEVLLLIGDAVLAIFPLPQAGGAAQACQAALEAARDAGPPVGVQQIPGRTGRSGDRLRHRIAPRRAHVRQHRRAGTPAVHGGRARRERGGAARDPHQDARPAGPGKCHFRRASCVGMGAPGPARAARPVGPARGLRAAQVGVFTARRR